MSDTIRAEKIALEAIESVIEKLESHNAKIHERLNADISDELERIANGNGGTPPTVDRLYRLHSPYDGYEVEDNKYLKGQFIPSPAVSYMVSNSLDNQFNERKSRQRILVESDIADAIIEATYGNGIVEAKKGRAFESGSQMNCYLYVEGPKFLVNSFVTELDSLTTENVKNEAVAPTGRVEVNGTVLKIKDDYDQFYNNFNQKAFVKLEDGSTCYGNIPKSAIDKLSSGDSVKFTATFESSEDPSHAYFKRMSKLTLVNKNTVENKVENVENTQSVKPEPKIEPELKEKPSDVVELIGNRQSMLSMIGDDMNNESFRKCVDREFNEFMKGKKFHISKTPAIRNYVENGSFNEVNNNILDIIDNNNDIRFVIETEAIKRVKEKIDKGDLTYKDAAIIGDDRVAYEFFARASLNEETVNVAMDILRTAQDRGINEKVVDNLARSLQDTRLDNADLVKDIVRVDYYELIPDVPHNEADMAILRGRSESIEAVRNAYENGFEQKEIDRLIKKSFAFERLSVLKAIDEIKNLPDKPMVKRELDGLKKGFDEGIKIIAENAPNQKPVVENKKNDQMKFNF